MNDNATCGKQEVKGLSVDYETVRIEKTRNVCPMCEDYAVAHAAKPVVVMCCEGACLRGEIARQAANLLCHKMAADKTARLCLGGAFTKDGGQRKLARTGEKVIVLEGCFIECASRMMKAVVPELKPDVIIADALYNFDRSLFGIDEMAEIEIKGHAQTVAKKVLERL